MKKLKSFKTLTSLSAIAAITPIVATSCNDNEITKTNIDTLSWNTNGNYLVTATINNVLDEFKQNNKTLSEGGLLPDDVYDNITITILGHTTWWEIYLRANDDSLLYSGYLSLHIDASKININTLNWTLGDNYYLNMDKEQIIANFISNNKVLMDGGKLPNDIYSWVNVNAIKIDTKWHLSVDTIQNNVYVGNIFYDITPTKVNVNIYNWSSEGSYTLEMSDKDIKKEFIKNNPIESEGGELPDDIYDDGNLAWIISKTDTTINITLTGSGSIYNGTKNISIQPISK